MSDPILLFLIVDAAALVLLGVCASAVPSAACGFVTTMLSGLGGLLCLPPLLMRATPTAFVIPVGPPGLSLHFALDPLSGFFLLIVFLSGTAIAALQATANPPSAIQLGRLTALTIAGSGLALLAADGVTLTIGVAVACGIRWLPRPAAGPLLIPLLLLAAVCLLTPSGFAPRFDAVRAAPVDADRAIAAAALTIAAVVGLAWNVPAWAGSGWAGSGWAGSASGPIGSVPTGTVATGSVTAGPVTAASVTAGAARTGSAWAGSAWAGSAPETANSCESGAGSWVAAALGAGVLIPLGGYLLLRVIADLSSSTTQTGCGFVLLLAGAAVAVIQAWRAAGHPDIDGSLVRLTQRQTGLMMASTGLALIARAADLPDAAAFALAAALLSAIGGAASGVVASFAVHAIGASTGTYRLSRLGGLIHTMPVASAALAAGLLGLSAVPPGVGFAGLWLLLQSILSGPRTGGLLFQLPLALTAGALALSAALTTAGAVRLAGVALLGRPRTPQGAGAHESKPPSRLILLTLAGITVVTGILPGALLWLIASPAIRAMAGAASGMRVGLTLLVPSSTSPSYLALPVFALLALATGMAMLLARRTRQEAKTAGPWSDGMEPPPGLPFGDPAAQSVGAGFLPAFPAPAWPGPPRLPGFAPPRPPSATAVVWLLIAAFAALLLALALVG
ncbi:MAG TPA: proton-conducting transporter membrane subunit [Rhodopila sp.]